MSAVASAEKKTFFLRVALKQLLFDPVKPTLRRLNLRLEKSM
jgi:hypothetical protein